MKTAYRIMMVVAMVALVMSCRSKADEKKIAELENRLAEIEKKSAPASPTITPSNETPATAAEEKPEGPLPTATFESLEHDFGTKMEGDEVKFDYKVTNNGQAPLIIQNAQPSCGCTVPSWTKEPIPVGGTGVITALFDTKGKSGMQNKSITVTANTWPKVTTLRFKGMVTPKAK